MNKLCGNCNFQGGSKADKQGVRIFCLYDNESHSDRYSCKYWTGYLNNISSDARVKMASDLRSSVESQRRHCELLKHNAKIAIFYFLAGILITLFTQWIFSLWK